MPLRHEVPTHLGVEDRVFAGLSMRQVLLVVSGLSAAYGLWSQWPDLPSGMRMLLAGACATVALAIALCRPAGRGLEEWALLALRHAVAPKALLWRPRDVDLGPDHDGPGWTDYRPVVGWMAADPAARDTLP